MVLFTRVCVRHVDNLQLWMIVYNHQTSQYVVTRHTVSINEIPFSSDKSDDSHQCGAATVFQTRYQNLTLMGPCVVGTSSKYPTRCNITQFIYICKLLYMFRVVSPPIIRSTHNWFPFVHKQTLRWFPRLQVATACFSYSPPDLNFLDHYFIFMYKHYNHCHRVTAHLKLNILLLLLLLLL